VIGSHSAHSALPALTTGSTRSASTAKNGARRKGSIAIFEGKEEISARSTSGTIGSSSTGSTHSTIHFILAIRFPS
jgi:hypothetical protein